MANMDLENAIAIVGMALRVPGANNLNEYWDNLVQGRDCGRELSKDDVRKWGVTDDLLDHPDYVYRSYEVDNIDQFDAKFFGISPREARTADPQLRLSLETTYECIEDSGHDLMGKNVGFYFGVADHKYWMYYNLFQNEFEDDNEVAKRIVAFKDFFATQISHKLGLEGPSISLSSACSTGLLAVHEACNHLMMYDCDYAIAGGCEIFKRIGYKYMDGGLSSKDGYLRAFDRDASGTVFGSGVGVVALRRMSDALRDGDRIYAVIHATAVNNDGNQKVGYMAPGVKGQMGVIQEAMHRANVVASDIGYVEAHGTGTKVGDPIEINSISQVYRRYTDDNQFCAIGSVKTNLGHLSMAAGIAGIIKVSLMLHHRKFVPSLHYNEANPAIDFQRSPFYVNTEYKDWVAEDASRKAGISSFGVGGTNVHAIIGEAPAQSLRQGQGPHNHLLTLSAKGSPALQQMAAKFAAFLQAEPGIRLADVCYSQNQGRHAHSTRAHVYAASVEDAVKALTTLAETTDCGQHVKDSLPVVFMFPGQGSQYINAGRQLYQQPSVYRDVVTQCATLLQQQIGLDVLSVFYAEDEAFTEKSAQLNRTEYAQLCLFINAYAMAKQWQHWGVQPESLIGHSIGEYVAGCLAGVFSLSDALTLVYHRGRLMQSMAAGSMLSVMLAQQEIEPYLNDRLSVSVVNSAFATVVSGDTEAVTELQQRLSAQQIKSTLLQTSHAFHSVMMEPMLDQFRAVLDQVSKLPPQIPLISNVTGGWLDSNDAVTSDYWVCQLRQAVLFAKGIETLQQEGPCIFIEMGPGAALTSLLRQGDLNENKAVRTMRKSSETLDDQRYLYNAVGEFFSAGGVVDWAAFYGEDHGNRISLPSYPFQHQSYWLDEDELRTVARQPQAESVLQREHPLLGNRVVSSPQVIIYENTLDCHTPDFVNDHRLLDTVIFPGAGFTQMALAIGKFFAKNKKMKVDDIRFANALMLHEGQQKTVQIIATARSDGGCSFEILSKNAGLNDDRANWVLHAKGRISLHSVIPELYPMPELFQRQGAELLPLSRYYDALRFITFGPKFRPVKRMWIGRNESLGWCELPESLVADAAQYSYHPVLLDAAFQVIDGPRITESGTLPVGLKNLTVYGPVPNQFYVHALRHDDSPEQYSIGQMTIFDEHGRVIARIEHYLQKQIADSVAFSEQLSDVLYEIEWKPAAHTGGISQQKKSWLVIGEHGPQLDSLMAELERHGQDAWPLAGSRLDKAAISQLLQQQPADAIVFARALSNQQNALVLSTELLDLVNALSESELKKQPALFLLTSGAQVLPGDRTVQLNSVDQTVLWGFGNTITVEHPELCCVRIDLDPVQQDMALLVADLLTPDKENQLLYRQGRRYIPRLTKFHFADQDKQKLNVPNGPYDIRLTKFGTFDSFSVREFIPDIVNDDQVLVEMHCAALNFKETLYVLGFLNPNGRDATDFDFGMEGAGRIKKVGKKVTHLKVGDDVIVWENGCLRSDFVVNANRVTLMPAGLSYQQASCIPTVYMTAYYALHDLARLKAGDKVLIHAAAGGVGQVAIQIAKAVGAEIYATASEGKWEHLRQQEIRHIYNSRTLDFADAILRDTGGRGVDVVFNSLAGDFIQRSFDVLAEQGRFIEIGKTNIWSNEQAAAYRSDVFYRFFEVGEDIISGGIGEASPIGQLMDRVLADVSGGLLTPMPLTEFELQDLPAAYRYLSAGKNIGKVVINLDAKSAGHDLDDCIKTDQTYLITGGLGALGMLSAAWLIEHGAKYLVLTSRSAPSDLVQSKIDDWRKVGVRVEIARGDVGVRADIQRIFDFMDAQMPALAGVLHCAGVLEDGVISQQSAEQFSRSFAPKVDGSWYLHELTQDRQLQMFVFFSSVSAIFDGGGQANYAAANAFMDRLAAHRRSLGLPGLSVNWGGWADAGMAANLATNRAVHTELFINKGEAFMALERLLIEERVQGTVCKLGERLNPLQVPLLLSELVVASDDEESGMTELERVLLRHPTQTLQENLELLVSQQVAKVLGLSNPADVSRTEEFVDLGVDSLSMTELKNAMQNAIGKNLKMAVFFANSSIKRFVGFLQKEFGDQWQSQRGGPQTAVATNPVAARQKSIEFVRLVDSQCSDMLFCVPGLNSNVFDFMQMAEAWKGKYQLQIGQVNTELEHLETDIRQIAAQAIVEMRQLQPDGEYALVGYSYGGVVCLEIANQLREQGLAVKLLLMIDSFPHFQHVDDPRFMQFMSALITDSVLAPMTLPADAYAEYAARLINAPSADIAAFMQETDRDSSGASRLNLQLLDEIVTVGELKAKAHYLPPATIDGIDINFIRASGYPAAMQHARLDGFLETDWMTDPAYGWGRFVSNRFEVTEVATNHNMLLKQDHVRSIMSVIDQLYHR